jgi:IMP dehydrogenase
MNDFFRGKTFDDFLIAPRLGVIQSRAEVSLDTWLTCETTLHLPIASANMDTVTNSEMAVAMGLAGGIGFIHRAQPLAQQIIEVARSRLRHLLNPVAATVGVTGCFEDTAVKLVEAGATVILLDTAHGHSIQVGEAVKRLKNLLPPIVDIVAGNVATYDGARFLADLGVDAIKVGIGAGSACRTRIETGFGVGQLEAISEAHRAVGDMIPIIADGGIRQHKDIFMALLVGASTVMLGGMLAGTSETPGQVFSGADGVLYKEFRGMASARAQANLGMFYNCPEGLSTRVPYKGTTELALAKIQGYLQSSVSYAGCSSLAEVHETLTPNLEDILISISPATQRESYIREE